MKKSKIKKSESIRIDVLIRFTLFKFVTFDCDILLHTPGCVSFI